MHECPRGGPAHAPNADAIPHNIHLRGGLDRLAESAAHEALDVVCHARLGVEWLCGLERPGLRVVIKDRAEQSRAVSRVREGCGVEEYCSVMAIGRGRTDPVGVGFGEAEAIAIAAAEALKPAVGEDRFARIAARVGHDEVTLTEVDGSGFVGNEIVLWGGVSVSTGINRGRRRWGGGEHETHHGAGVGRRDAAHNRAPDIKVGAATAIRVRTAGVAELSAGVDVIFVEEGKAHVLGEWVSLRQAFKSWKK